MTPYIPSLASIEAGLVSGFTGVKETNIRVIRGMNYKHGYGADLKKIYFVRSEARWYHVLRSGQRACLKGSSAEARISSLPLWGQHRPVLGRLRTVHGGTCPVRRSTGQNSRRHAVGFWRRRVQRIPARYRGQNPMEVQSGETDLLLDDRKVRRCDQTALFGLLTGSSV